ncbi:hypothetical protein TUM4438_43220 [Shewanella sairae]|uniref:Uncharacterized protein n=1 Tax=Shewanella sairae TaxID=190310 RepID=A0ABQ4PSC8_9GAMM|nr:hypothetical protein [Shewanella sairae]MCL1132448.1 hypothetical protein [Shewanella sairae]GIU51927.1 hypothetical protein TUM4438_43220 [Shewanella sairae]
MTKPTPQARAFEFNCPNRNSEAGISTKSKSEKALYYAKARAGVGEYLERIALARELGIPVGELEDF